jgi:hypothetical protein
MRTLAIRSRKEETMEARRQRRKELKDRKREEKRKQKEQSKKRLKQESQEIKGRSLEWRTLQEQYPETLFKFLIIKKVHPDLRFRFRAACAADGFSMSGKVRKLIADFVEGKIDNYDLENKMHGINPIKIFGEFPPGVKQTMTFCHIPRVIHLKYRKWCALRGISMSWKTKQLMVALIFGHLK